MAILFGLALLIIGISRGSAENQKVALVTIAAAALLTLVLYLTGKPATGVVKSSPDFVDMIVERHQTTAALAVTTCSMLGTFAFAGLLLFRRKVIAGWYGITLLFAGVVVCLILVWTSNLGGQIRHSEIRAANPVTATDAR